MSNLTCFVHTAYISSFLSLAGHFKSFALFFKTSGTAAFLHTSPRNTWILQEKNQQIKFLHVISAWKTYGKVKKKKYRFYF